MCDNRDEMLDRVTQDEKEGKRKRKRTNERGGGGSIVAATAAAGSIRKGAFKPLRFAPCSALMKGRDTDSFPITYQKLV